MNIAKMFRNDKRRVSEKKEELFNYLVCVDGGRSVLEMLVLHFGYEMVKNSLNEIAAQQTLAPDAVPAENTAQ
jgi:hypothetical protein